MTMHVVIDAYRRTCRMVAALTALHISVRLAVSAVMLPLAGVILGLGLQLSGDTALTDQEIAGFLLSPYGAVGAIMIAGLLIVAVLLDVALMALMLARPDRGRWTAVTGAWRELMTRLPAFFALSSRLVLRVAALSLPFVGLSGAVALLALGEHDINYYLTYRPPEFIVAAAVIASLALALAALLIRRLAGWSLAVHLLLFDRVPPRDCLGQSTALLRTRRGPVIRHILGWAVVRLALAAGIAAAMGAAVAGAQMAALPDLSRVVFVTVLVLVIWSLLNAALAGVSNGALAQILGNLHSGIAPGRHPGGAGDAMPSAVPVLTGLVFAAVVGALGAVFLIDRAADRLATPRSVEIIAHRGAAADRPENTLAAVEKALEDRADWVEIDVQEISDGTVVVAHDSDFMKQAGNALKVWDAKQGDLERIDIGSWFDPAYSDARVPTLRAVLDAARGQGRVLVELKYYGHDERLEERVAQIIEQAGMAQNVMIMSLKRAGVEKMHALRPDWPMGILAARAIGDLTALDADFLAVNTGQVSQRLLRRAQASGKKVYVWTVDDPRTMSRMISMGVDGIITNKPALARQIMESRLNLSLAGRMLVWLSDRFRLDSFDLTAESSDA